MIESKKFMSKNFQSDFYWILHPWKTKLDYFYTFLYKIVVRASFSFIGWIAFIHFWFCKIKMFKSIQCKILLSFNQNILNQIQSVLITQSFESSSLSPSLLTRNSEYLESTIFQIIQSAQQSIKYGISSENLCSHNSSAFKAFSS